MNYFKVTITDHLNKKSVQRFKVSELPKFINQLMKDNQKVEIIHGETDKAGYKAFFG